MDAFHREGLVSPEKAIPAGYPSIQHGGGAPRRLAFYGEDGGKVDRQGMAAAAKRVREAADQSYGDRPAGVEGPLGLRRHLATHGKDAPAATAVMREHEPA